MLLAVSIFNAHVTRADMDVELSSVITAVSKNKSIRHFHMGRNVINVRAKHVSVIVEALVRMIQVRFITLACYLCIPFNLPVCRCSVARYHIFT